MRGHDELTLIAELGAAFAGFLAIVTSNFVTIAVHRFL
jgi:hypothetical protein